MATVNLNIALLIKLKLLQPCILRNQFLRPITRKIDGQLRVFTFTFDANNQPLAVLCVAHACVGAIAGAAAFAAAAALWCGVAGTCADRAVVNFLSLLCKEFAHAVGAVI